MDEERQAQALVEQWVRAHVVPKIMIFLGTTEYLPDVTIESVWKPVRLHRTLSGQVQVTYANRLIGQALEQGFPPEYLVGQPRRSGTDFTTYIMPKG